MLSRRPLNRPLLLGAAGLLAVALLAAGVGVLSGGRHSPPPGPALSPTELKYRLIDTFGPPQYCDRDFYPLGRPELPAALAAFPTIAQDAEAFAVILRRNHLDPGSTLVPEQKLKIYQDYKQLQAVVLEPGSSGYRFVLVAPDRNKQQAIRVEGSIDPSGLIQVAGRTPTYVNCPICLAAGTRIDTPQGSVFVQDLHPGMAVWTAERTGARYAAVILQVSRTRVAASHQMVHLALSDGRELTASPGHPTTDLRVVGELLPGDQLDGAPIVTAERIAYSGEATYDLLPSGDTGWYWADGVLVASTLRR